MASAKGVGIPVKLLHEAEGHVVTVELKSGENYRGELIEAEDNWNCQMKNVQATAKVRTRASHCVERCTRTPVHAFTPGGSIKRHTGQLTHAFEQDGRASNLEHIFVRGSRIRCAFAGASGLLCCDKCSRVWLLSAAVLPHRFMIIPDMLKNAPMFKRIDPKHKVLPAFTAPPHQNSIVITSDCHSVWSVLRSPSSLSRADQGRSNGRWRPGAGCGGTRQGKGGRQVRSM